MRINYLNLSTNLSLTEAQKKVSDLLTYEHIGFQVCNDSIKSIKIPLPIVNFDTRIYSKKNWIGLNPFIYISKIEIDFIKSNTREMHIRIRIDYQRAILLYICFLCLILLVALAIPIIWVGVLFFSLLAISSYLFLFNLCLKNLIKHEVLNEVNGTIE